MTLVKSAHLQPNPVDVRTSCFVVFQHVKAAGNNLRTGTSRVQVDATPQEWPCPDTCASTASRLNEAGFWRGGNLTKSSICPAMTACIRYIWGA